MTSTKGPSHNPVDAQLDRLRRGSAVDWKNAKLSAPAIAKWLLSLSLAGGALPPLTFTNAQFVGDLILDTIGAPGTPLRLQFINCRFFGGLRLRQSAWKQLVIGGSSISFIDAIGAQFEADLVIEDVNCRRWLELQLTDIGRKLILSSSRFHCDDRIAAVSLDDARVGRGIDGKNIKLEGSLVGKRIRVGGDVLLDGAVISDPDEPSVAINFQGAEISGVLRLASNEDSNFEARGRIQLSMLKAAALIIKAAKLDGVGAPAVIAENIALEVLDVSGLSHDGGPRLDVKGAMLFGGARVARQFQLYDVDIHAADVAVQLYGLDVDGDMLIGHESWQSRFRGSLTADRSRVRGRLIVCNIEVDSGLTAFGMSQASIGGDASFWTVNAKGAIRLGDTEAGGLHMEDVLIGRGVPSPPGTENYAHEHDALLELNHVRIKSDVFIKSVALTGGDCRMIGAQLGGGVQLNGLVIDSPSDCALIAQGAVVAGAFMLMGVGSDRPDMLGMLHLYGMSIQGDVTILNAKLGSADRASKLVLRGTSIKGHLTMLHCATFGEINLSGAKIGGECKFHSSQHHNNGKVAFDLRGCSVAGMLQWATAARAEGIASSIDGEVTTDGAKLGALSWGSVELRDGTILRFTNTIIERHIRAEQLVTGDKCGVSLSGTSVPLLIDSLDDKLDGWGGSKTMLKLDNFDYARLDNPSGRGDDGITNIRRWRSGWLKRQPIPRSPRPPRHLALVLKNQGLVEASRFILMDAFRAEAASKQSISGKAISWLFGLLFGYGLSGKRALSSLIGLWLLGVVGVVALEQRGMLVTVEGDKPAAACGNQIDPLLYAADAMIPLIDLGQEDKCQVGPGPNAKPAPSIGITNRHDLSFGWPLARFLSAIYAMLGWTFVSLAIATWSGLFRRGGRE